MTRTSEQLEAAVAAILALPSAERRAACRGPSLWHVRDLQFLRIMDLIAPRTRYLIARYGLAAHLEDAEQACAIAVHRALASYDPQRAAFSTHVTWQLRAELKALRQRLLPAPAARQVSLDAVGDGWDEFIADPAAWPAAEESAAARLAVETLDSLLDDYAQSTRRAALQTREQGARRMPARPGTVHHAEVEERLVRERAIVTRYVFAEDRSALFAKSDALSTEQQRQIARRVLRHLRTVAQSRMLH